MNMFSVAEHVLCRRPDGSRLATNGRGRRRTGGQDTPRGDRGPPHLDHGDPRAVATLFLVIGGLRYMTAAGDPAGVEQAKGSFKAALTGYALAVLAPVVLQVLQGILGG
jgi:Type IV secretion system pilin